MSRADIIMHMLRYRMVGEVTLRFSSVEEAQQFAACVARHRAEAG